MEIEKEKGVESFNLSIAKLSIMKKIIAFLSFTLLLTACEDGLFGNDNEDNPDDELYFNGTWDNDDAGRADIWLPPDENLTTIYVYNELKRNDSVYDRTLFLDIPDTSKTLNDTLYFNEKSGVNGSLSLQVWGTPSTFDFTKVDTGWIYFTYHGPSQNEDVDNATDVKGSFWVQYIDLNNNEPSTVEADFWLRDYHL